MKKLLLALVLFLSSLPAVAALEEWSCSGIADYYGFVAVDRDNGVPFKARSNKTVDDIIVVMDSTAAPMDVAAEDAQALLQIVRYVYQHTGTPYQIRREALLTCMRTGVMEAPAFGPAVFRRRGSA